MSNPTVKSIDVRAAKAAVKACSLEVRQYVKALEELVEIQKEGTKIALTKIRLQNNVIISAKNLIESYIEVLPTLTITESYNTEMLEKVKTSKMKYDLNVILLKEK